MSNNTRCPTASGWMGDDPLRLCLKGQFFTPPAWWRKKVFLICGGGSCKFPAPCQPGSDATNHQLSDHQLSGTRGAAMTRAPALSAKQRLKNLESTRFSVQRGQSPSSLGRPSASMGPQRCSEQQTLAPKFGEPGQTLASRIFTPKPAFRSRPLLTLKCPRISSPAVGRFPPPALPRSGGEAPDLHRGSAAPARVGTPPNPFLPGTRRRG